MPNFSFSFSHLINRGRGNELWILYKISLPIVDYHCKVKSFKHYLVFENFCLIYKPYIQQNTGRWVPNTIPLSYMLVNAGRRITSIPLVVDLRDRYIWQNTYYGGQQVELCEVSEEFLCHYHPHKTAMDVLMECQFS